MKLFSTLYKKVLDWSAHHNAPYYLGALSFAESSFFPVPPDVMLISMTLAKPKKAWQYALITTLGSVIGGLFGYFIGAYFIGWLQPYIQAFGYADSYAQVQHWFSQWGFWIIFLAGFSPIPYKIFTIGAGAIHMMLIPFFIASLVSRGLRFFLVSAALHWGGERLSNWIHRYVDILGWLMIALFVVILSLWHLGVI